jgi:hypothetical protein
MCSDGICLGQQNSKCSLFDPMSLRFLPYLWVRVRIVLLFCVYYMAWPMGFRIRAASSSGRMPEGCPFPVSVCIAASASAMNTTSRPIGSWTFGLRGLWPLIQNALFRPASAAGELRRRKIVLEPGIISSGWIGTEATCPSTSCTSWPKPYGGFLDSDGDRHAIANLDELLEAVDRVKAYQDFQPDRFNRRELNLQLRALAQDCEARL